MPAPGATSALGDEFLDIVQAPGRWNELLGFPNVKNEAVKVGCKNLEALEMMEKLKLPAIPVVDEK